MITVIEIKNKCLWEIVNQLLKKYSEFFSNNIDLVLVYIFEFLIKDENHIFTFSFKHLNIICGCIFTVVSEDNIEEYNIFKSFKKDMKEIDKFLEEKIKNRKELKDTITDIFYDYIVNYFNKLKENGIYPSEEEHFDFELKLKTYLTNLVIERFKKYYKSIELSLLMNCYFTLRYYESLGEKGREKILEFYDIINCLCEL